MKIKEIFNQKEWDDFVTLNDTNTFLHSWLWGEFQKKIGNAIKRIGFFEDSKLRACMLIIKICAKRGTFLFVPHGPICTKNTFNQSFLNKCTQYLSSIAIKEKCSFIRIAPVLPRNTNFENIFKKEGYIRAPIHIHSEQSWILNITDTTEMLLKKMRKSTRNILKKEKEYPLEYERKENTNILPLFYDLYKQTVKRARFSGYSYDYILKEFEVFSSNKSAYIYSVYKKKKLLSTAFIIIYGKSGFYHHGASLQKNENIPASHLLQWYIIKDLKKMGLSYYNFWGIAPSDKPHHPWHGLTIFKRGFGGEEKQYLQTQDYIITPLYWYNWIIETIRRIYRRY